MQRIIAILAVPLLAIVALSIVALQRADPRSSESAADGTEHRDGATLGPSADRHRTDDVEEVGESLEAKFDRILAEDRESDLPDSSSPVDLDPLSVTSAARSDFAAATDRPAAEFPVRAIQIRVVSDPRDLAQLDSSRLYGRLVLTGDSFTNRSLRQLEGIHALSVSVEAVNVSNAGLAHLTKMIGLRELRLWTPAVNDDGLKILAGVADLESLDLEGTSVRGSGLAWLNDSKQLENLTLGQMAQDEAIPLLETLPGLRELDLRSCHRLTDACAASLGRLRNLHTVWLPSTILDAGKRAVSAALPRCQVRS